MRRFAVGSFFVLHGLAHVPLGLSARAAPDGIAAAFPASLSLALATGLFLVAASGFFSGGLGRWGVPGLRLVWAPLVRLAVLGSALLVVLFERPSVWTVLGLVLDGVALSLAAPERQAGPLRRAA